MTFLKWRNRPGKQQRANNVRKMKGDSIFPVIEVWTPFIFILDIYLSQSNLRAQESGCLVSEITLFSTRKRPWGGDGTGLRSDARGPESRSRSARAVAESSPRPSSNAEARDAAAGGSRTAAPGSRRWLREKSCRGRSGLGGSAKGHRGRHPPGRCSGRSARAPCAPRPRDA